MTALRRTIVYLSCAGLAACASSGQQGGTLSELQQVPADIEDIYVADSLERAADSYRRYLEETKVSARTPEAMRRLADLQIEQAYGVMGSGDIVEMAAPKAVATASTEMAAPESAAVTSEITATASRPAPTPQGESDAAFEERASQREELLAARPTSEPMLPDGTEMAVPAGPREAIATYWEILETYPNYERNDQVLYQLSRAYEEIGDPDKAMDVMDRFVTEYPYSRYVDEVYFRRGEYYFVRKRYLEAEESYAAIITMGGTSNYYELALYKLGWALYKQELYEDALHQYMAMLDHRLAIGFDFDAEYDADDEHRLADTFRVISLSFSNLGGPEVLDEYFARSGQRSYADKIYGNLAEFYFEKLRYEDAASVYKSFVDLNPYHRVAPHFGMRVVDIYAEAAFPRLVVEAKKDFAERYAIDAEYWAYFDMGEAPEVARRVGHTNVEFRRGRWLSQAEPDRPGRPLPCAVPGGGAGRRAARQLRRSDALVPAVPGLVPGGPGDAADELPVCGPAARERGLRRRRAAVRAHRLRLCRSRAGSRSRLRRGVCAP